ncbi:MAG TPA: winged helix-turn-helix domain-containing protein [Patescibacteria group bacterium]|nr:winged helix-turn-helix domain-containing protein [Patescibacteria group bacterium]
MSENNEEVYTTIFNALRHGVRRRILRMLSEGSLGFTTLYETLGISSSHLTYHLDALRELVSKNDSKYKLSVFGEAAVGMMNGIEEPPRPMSLVQGGDRFKVVAGFLVIVLLAMSGMYINLNDVSRAQRESLTLKDAELASMVAGLQEMDGLPELFEVIAGSESINIASYRKMMYSYNREAWAANEYVWYMDTEKDSVFVFYVPFDGTVLRIVNTMFNIPKDFYMPLSLQKGNALLNESGVVHRSFEIMGETFTDWCSPVIWSHNATGWGNIYEVGLPTKGWYTLSLTGPMTFSESSELSIDYMWGERAHWMDLDSFSVKCACEVLKDGERVYFAMETDVECGLSGWWLGSLDTE